MFGGLSSGNSRSVTPHRLPRYQRGPRSVLTTHDPSGYTHGLIRSGNCGRAEAHSTTATLGPTSSISTTASLLIPLFSI
jgi:hypothetical protein